MKRMVEYLGIDLGGTKTEVCLFDQNFRVLQNEVKSTGEFRRGGLELIDDLKTLVRQYFRPSLARLGVALKGSVKDGRVIASSLLGGLDVNYPLVAEFRKEFKVEVRLENDVKAQTLAEGKFGLGQGVDSFALINVGTGLAVGYVDRGELRRGFSGNFGSIYKVPTFSPPLGQTVFLEDIVSGKGIRKSSRAVFGEEKSAGEIFSLRKSDPQAKAVADLFAEKFTDLLVLVTCFYNPQKIILSGGVVKHAPAELLEEIRQNYAARVFPFQRAEVVTSTLEHAACLGVVA